MATLSYLVRGGGSQSRQTPIAAVTAWLLVPNQGEIIAPNPPAGPPAATNNRWSGLGSAQYSVSPLSRITEPLPTVAHSERLTRAFSNR